MTLGNFISLGLRVLTCKKKKKGGWGGAVVPWAPKGMGTGVLGPRAGQNWASAPPATKLSIGISKETVHPSPPGG